MVSIEKGMKGWGQWFDTTLEHSSQFYGKSRDMYLEKRERDEGMKLVFIGLGASVIILFGLLFSMVIPAADAVAFFFIYMIVYLLIAIKTGAIALTENHGYGEGARILDGVRMNEDMECEVETYYRDRWLPELVDEDPPRQFLDGLDDAVRKDAYNAFEKDIAKIKEFDEKGRAEKDDHYPTIIFVRHDDLLSVIDYNTGYLGLFFMMSVVYLVLFIALAITMPGVERTFMAVLLLVILEEVAKGSGYWMTKTKEVDPKAFGRIKNANFKKGMVCGCGFAFIEAFSVLRLGVEPASNLFLGIVTALPVHMIASGLFFVGIDLFMEFKRTKKARRGAWKHPLVIQAVKFCVLGVLIHLSLNLSVWWFFG